MAKPLPFVVQPRLASVMTMVGSEESGQFEIERKGFLSVAEKTFVQEAMRGQEGPKQLVATVARIAKLEGKTPTAVFDDIGSGDEDRNEYLSKYQDELTSQGMAMAAYTERLKIVEATCLLTQRHDPSWGVEDTLGLHPDILEGLHSLYQDEEARNIDELLREAKKEPSVAPQEGSGKA